MGQNQGLSVNMKVDLNDLFTKENDLFTYRGLEPSMGQMTGSNPLNDQTSLAGMFAYPFVAWFLLTHKA